MKKAWNRDTEDRRGSGWKLLGRAIPLLLLTVLLGAGCTRQTGTDVDPSETGESITGETSVTEPAGTKPSDIEPSGIEPEPSVPASIESFPDKVTEPVEEPEVRPDWEKTAIVATDIHYLARSLTDGGSSFQYMVEHGDGKVVTYIEQIVDAFLEEVIAQKPDMLILSGDLTLDGEKKSHEELAGKLYQVQDAGIPVIVIPGNHDINNHHAAEYRGNDRFPAEFTTPREFRDIYQDFGYNEAISRDRTTLSYVYEVDEYNRLLMLDTCQYRGKARVGGAILSDTYDWIDLQLEEAWDDGMNVIPVAHHNLLDQSEIYVDDCTIEHGEQLVERLEDWDVPLFLSGHLHVQHTKRSDEDRGVWEMVTSSLATPACQYGVLKFRDDGSFDYHTQAVDVEGWAKRHNRTEEDLLEFDTFKEPFLRRVFYNQSYDTLQKIPHLDESQRRRMSEVYTELNYHYYQGTAYLVRDQVLANPDYELWEGDGASTVLTDYVEYIISDAKRDYNRVVGK